MVTEQTASLGGVLDFGRRFAEPLDAALRRLSAAWPLPGDGLRESAVGQVVEQVRAVFATPLHDVLASGWNKSEECLAFCDPEEYPPEDVNTVELAEHTVSWGCEPAVEVVADGPAGGVAVADLRFGVEVEVVVRAGLLVIRNARFIRIEAAELDVSASLSLEGFIVAAGETTLELPGALAFGEHGVPIQPLRASEAEAALA